MQKNRLYRPFNGGFIPNPYGVIACIKPLCIRNILFEGEQHEFQFTRHDQPVKSVVYNVCCASGLDKVTTFTPESLPGRFTRQGGCIHYLIALWEM